MQLQNTLYVTTENSYLRLQGDTVRIEVDGEKRSPLPLHHFNAIYCFGNIMLSPALMHRCADDGRSIILFDRNGRFKARLEGQVSGNVLLRQAHYEHVRDNQKCTEHARAFIAGKIKNSRQILLRGGRETHSEEEGERLRDSAKRLGNIVQKLPNADNLDTLRGYEGDAARLYFDHLSLVIKPAYRQHFAMQGRNRRPPRDRINALLSFLYAILLNDCRSALEGVGLDPQFGFLHVLRPGRPALALDLLEEFRAPIADRLALTLINRDQLKANHFDERPGNTVMLNDEGRKTVLTAYQKRKQEELEHPVLEKKIAIGLLPHIQARLLARTLRGDTPGYIPFLAR